MKPKPPDPSQGLRPRANRVENQTPRSNGRRFEIGNGTWEMNIAQFARSKARETLDPRSELTTLSAGARLCCATR